MAVKRYGIPEVRLDRAQRTTEGFLQGIVPISKIGVFPYRNQDGTTRYEARLPEDVFAKASIDSFKSKPIQINHPEMLNSPEAIARNKVGHIGDEVYVDGLYVMAKVTIDHPDGLAAVDAGCKELSCGYNLDVIEEPGEFMGMRYTHRQKNIRGDHLCATPKARLGADLRLDSADDAVQVDETQPIPSKERSVKYKIKNIEYDAAQEVVNFAEEQKDRADKAETKAATLQTQLDALTSEKSKADARADKAEADLAKSKTDMADLEKNIPARAAEMAKARAGIDSVAKAVLPAAQHKGLDAMDAEAVKAAVIKAKYPKLSLEKKDTAYVDNLFEAIQSDVNTKGGTTRAAADNRADSAPLATGDGVEMDGDMDAALEKARSDADKRQTDAWKKPALA
jgi:uncharacterized protein